jgi:hypothetical protein
LPLFSFSQENIPKKANTIEVNGVSFRELANQLLDANFNLERVDSSFQTIKTEFKSGTGKSKWMKLRLLARVKDSTAIISGEWYNTMLVGAKLLGVEYTIENLVERIQYSSGNSKSCFMEMRTFAMSFKKPTVYLVK